MKALTRTIAIGMFVFPVIAQAQTEPPIPPAAPATDAKAADAKPAYAKPAATVELICVDQQASTGSRLHSHRECHTKEEWDKLGTLKR